ncbi:hypothetical protein PZ938_00105 [Luteipulveratus sp. YIM 133132]|uniref:hypothetical protein n=1 Tax=Luteipulveratus flavus TaxID=3031728 RepID=UPI0023B04436|nr:hypothetical protein [Luteipulveratus sp. YIM 133132]MDE9363996.1 hypothetical protein [Luteipulveratus sp. YIM 133132]
MAERHEVEAWVNPSAWDNEDEAARVIEAILESGSDDELEWTRISGGLPLDDVAAANRAHMRMAEEADEALERLREACRSAHAAGETKIAICAAAGISRPTLDSWLARDGSSR